MAEHLSNNSKVKGSYLTAVVITGRYNKGRAKVRDGHITVASAG
jgi:hypothetical protein